MGGLGSNELRLMQELDQRASTLRPELVNGDASVGEPAWVWGKGYDTLRPFWKHRLWLVLPLSRRVIVAARTARVKAMSCAVRWGW